MRIGWRAYLKQKLRSSSQFFSVGIAIGAETVTFCALRQKDAELEVYAEDTVAFADWGRHFASWVEQHGLSNTPAYLAFSLELYRQVQVDRPPVEDHEVHAALSFSVEEILGSDTQWVFDYTDLDVHVAGNKKLNIFAIPQEAVAAASEKAVRAGVNLVQISVAELATCELMPATAEPLMLIVQETGEEVSLNIVKNGHLYVSRRLKGFENLGSFSEQELQMGLVDSLSVQVQRSMDYFESQLRQPPVRKIQLRLDTPHTALVAQQINQVIPAEVIALEPDVQVNAPLSKLRLNFTALGMALAPARHAERASYEGKAA
ncbi:biogenesis protein MshI [Alteromonas sp. ASW11-19]|uniref:Biogenesis protein MshI n=1 Tax=Alteromonas salexigens TaxID=2982530 RepID=A0ABT2VNL1_9ALTE|nr:biogenesis protein MshI [Alteromonas salexigens]MCU7554700.1 biogenesis protein MshI [Alteromonas salexigens]